MPKPKRHHIDRRTLLGRNSFSGMFRSTRVLCPFLPPIVGVGRQCDVPTKSWLLSVASWSMAPLALYSSASDVLADVSVVVDGAKGGSKASW